MKHSTGKPTKAQQERLDAIHAMPCREWKLVEGYGGLYRVSNTGRVQSCHKYGSRTGERCDWYDMRFFVTERGYLSVGFGAHGKRRKQYVHRLIAQAFIPNPNGFPAVNHIDGVKTHNADVNLEWCTNKRNSTHAVETGLIPRGIGHPFSKLSAAQVIAIRETTGRSYRSIGADFGVCAQTVCDVKRRSKYGDVR